MPSDHVFEAAPFTPGRARHPPAVARRAPAAGSLTGHASSSDAELLAGHRAGRRECVDLLVERHGPALWAALLHACRSEELARDLFQETWLRALGQLHTLREPEQLRSWLVSVALNLWRQERRRPQRTQPLGLEEFSLPAPLAPDQLESLDLSARLAVEVARLPERQRAVVELRMKAGLSYAEIAGLLDIREENARAHLYQGLQSLRTRCRGWLEGDDA